MTDRALLERLRHAVEQTAPNDITGVLTRCHAQKGRNDMKELEHRKKRRAAPWLAAACLVLVLAGSGFGLYQQANAVACAVSLDVNPSIELQLNGKSRVVAARALNDDAAAVLDGMDLKGADVNVAVNALIGSLLQHGYVDELANSILVTVEDSDSARGEALQQQLTGEIDAILSAASVNAAILSQTVAADDALQAKADQYGISLGKAALVQSLETQSDHLTFDALAGLSVNELNLLSSGTALPKTVASTGSASDSAYIGAEAAKQAALTRAGVAVSQVRKWDVDFDYEQGRLVYEVEFHTGTGKYECDVDASTGDIVSYQAENHGGQTSSPSQSGGSSSQGTTSGQRGIAASIGEAAAKAAALRHAGLSESAVTGLRVKEDWDDGTLEYEVKFWKDGIEYDYEIDAYTGAILKAEQERDDDAAPASAPAGDIGGDAARNAAFQHAGVSALDAWDVSVKRDDDDGKALYEVEFKANGLEYDYEIDASTGGIVSHQSEQDD